MVRVGLVGLGFMGQNHFNIYGTMDNAQVVAVCDKNPERVADAAAPVGGNIGDAQPLDLSAQAHYTSIDEMLAGEQLDVVDVCTPTHLHSEMTVKALEQGFNVICEKPMARTLEQCDGMISAASASGKMLFIAQCIRFWPEYEALTAMINDGRLGKVVSARFTRQSPQPTWASDGWLSDTSLSGGAMLDLHIHDVDFILSAFGKPKAVLSRAANLATKQEPRVDHAVTQYLYDGFSCVAEGTWVMPGTFPFEMGFQVLGEKGMLEFTGAKDPAFRFYPFDGEPYTPEVAAGTGYDRELAYFLSCIENGRAGDRVTPESARDSVKLVMAEFASAACGGIVEVC